MGYDSVDTFRKKPKATAVCYFADAVESYCINFHNRPLRQEYRIEAALRAIEQLNAAEHGEMVRRLRQRYAWFNTAAEQGLPGQERSPSPQT